MSILSVDNIQPIGSGTTVTVNKSVTLESGNTNITGVCTATSFSGSGANLTGLVSVANQADNKLITCTGTSNALNAETNLTYNGTKLTLTGNSADPVVEFINTSGSANQGDVLKLRASGRGAGIDDTDILLITNNTDTRTFGVSNAGTVNTTGNIIMAAGKGIDFSAQTASSATGTTVTSEILDHYEEGTWLPDVRGSSTAGTATYTSRSGRYVRIGRIVHVYTDVRWSAHNGAGGLEVHGLPFPQTGGYWGHFGINYNAGHSWTSGRQIYGWANIGGDFIRYWQTDSNGGSGNLPLDDVVGEIHFYGHYLTST